MFNLKDSRLDALRNSDVLEDVPVRHLRHLAHNVDEVSLRGGETLIHQGQVNRHAYFVVEGELDVIVDGARVATVTAGDVVGERSAFTRELANATIQARGPAMILVADHRALLGAAFSQPRLRDRIESLIAMRDADLTVAA